MDILKRARECSGISNQHMAAVLGVSYPTMQRIEANLKNARFGQIELVYENVNKEGRELIADFFASFFKKVH